MSTNDTASKVESARLAEAEGWLTSETPCQKEPARQVYDSDASPHALTTESEKAGAEPSTWGASIDLEAVLEAAAAVPAGATPAFVGLDPFFPPAKGVAQEAGHMAPSNLNSVNVLLDNEPVIRLDGTSGNPHPLCPSLPP
jgi:hypothetical protein